MAQPLITFEDHHPWQNYHRTALVGGTVERFFTPRLRFKTLEDLNGWLADKCVAYAKAHRHPEQVERTVWEAPGVTFPSHRQPMTRSWVSP